MRVPRSQNLQALEEAPEGSPTLREWEFDPDYNYFGVNGDYDSEVKGENYYEHSYEHSY